ncbi:TldD/PmbA family protein [Halobacteriovorax sp. GB3]|uniref:TldD/PmbA family protein n=1 Tax=Halobacteriovorax sp. GB3 TaxID=2719615 RepID=UPI002360C43E|nr:TldD/PmbA family protein [Halobacteriovorax sp. GB3]MDD0852837.1 TldD/PmbA family protein [Halobacteriovorax sp. GB3]
MKEISREVISELINMGASYADIRLHLRDEQEHISTLNGSLKNYSLETKKGLGIRVLFDGAWGFSSSETLTKEGVLECAKRAIDKAKASSKLIRYPIVQSPKEIVKTTYKSSFEIDPFSVSLEEKLNCLLDVDRKLSHERFDFWGAYCSFYKREIFYCDSEGTEFVRSLMEIDGGQFIMAKDCDGLNQRRSHGLWLDSEGTSGFENFKTERFDQAQRIKEELLQILDAPLLDKSKMDVVLLNDMMALQTHETIGHALELDRILGYELSYAGGSHISLEDFGTLKFGSSKLNARADGTVKNSPGSIGLDDDGVKAKNVLMIEKGILKDAITSRQMVVEANALAKREVFKESGATCRAESYNRMPIERMNNINIDFGSDGNFEELISKIDNGVILDTPRSWSIGSNRENFHFACEIGWRIEKGQVTGVVRNPSYRGESLEFWNALKYVGDQSTWKLMPTFNCGKGQPNQIMRLGHGVPVCVFSNVQVGD